VDVEPTLYGIDTDKIVPAITPRTRAIIPVHTFGQSCNMRDVSYIARLYDLKVIEDSCETVMVTHEGAKVGSMGHIGCFSFYVAHILSTGVGGMAITNDETYATKMRSLVNHGRDNVYISLDDSIDRTQEVLGKRFKFDSVGHSFRITELESAIGLAQLDTLKDIIIIRQLNARYLIDNLAHLSDYIQLPTLRETIFDHAFMMFPIVLKVGDKSRVCTYLEEHGIETRDMLPLIKQPVYNGLFVPELYPVASHINDTGFYIGCHQDLTYEDLQHVVAVISDCVRSA
jgi:perosamine synthetase